MNKATQSDINNFPYLFFKCESKFLTLIIRINKVKFIFLQENPPYNKGAFRIEVNFPAEYPFKPPKINFKTKIYHPNVDEKGQVSIYLLKFNS